MVSAITSLVSIALLLASVAFVGHSALASLHRLADAWEREQTRMAQTVRSRLGAVCTSSTGHQVYVVLKNTGEVPLFHFPRWDVFVQYYDTAGTYHQKRLVYTPGPYLGNNQWTVEGIYIHQENAIPERFQPTLLDPLEEVKLQFRLSPSANTTSANQVVVATANGVAVSTFFTGIDPRCD
ncbi:MAG: hypothetical protein NZ951_02915 [Dehalococcoidia bacterium]|nr:hypothetical protein [Dehalococcoidia bacterium]MDW8120116.1 hypothetical protein [Chloroflexota bacterium]